VDITVSGGSGTYSSYSWWFGGSEIATNEDISGLNNGGDYKVIVTDNTVVKTPTPLPFSMSGYSMHGFRRKPSKM
jgi:hypothetical protein